MAADGLTSLNDLQGFSTLLRRAQQCLNEATDLDEALRVLQSLIQVYTAVDSLVLLDAQADWDTRLQCTDVLNEMQKNAHLTVAESLQVGRLVYLSQSSCPSLRHPLTEELMASCLVVPVMASDHQGQLLLCVLRASKTSEFAPHVLSFFQILADFLATKITFIDLNAHIESEVTQRTNLLRREISERQHAENLQRTLFEIAELSTKRIDAESLYPSLHRILRGLFVVENFMIARFHQESSEISIEYFVDQVDGVPVKSRFPLGVGMTSFVFRSRQAQLIDQARLKKLIASGEIAQVVGNADMVSWMGAPMMLQEQIVGVVIVQSYDETLVYSEEELLLLAYVANYMATALGRHDADTALLQAQKDLQIQNEALHEKSLEQQSLITKLQEAHNQLIQSEKMATVGQLAAGVAHEINNPIGFVNANMGTLGEYIDTLFAVIQQYEELFSHVPATPTLLNKLQKIQSDTELHFVKDDVQSLLSESLDGLRRVKDIVQSLKDFSRVGETVWLEADIHQGIDSTLNIVKNELKNKATIIKKYAAIPALKCNISQLNQVFMNMLVNAGHAIENKGTITIETSEENGMVQIKISDTGVGISPEHISKIFEPFFTTKPIGSGTGLGLSLSYGIIKKHQGDIEVHSEPGKGSCFTIRLPRDPVPPEQA